MLAPREIERESGSALTDVNHYVANPPKAVIRQRAWLGMVGVDEGREEAGCF